MGSFELSRLLRRLHAPRRRPDDRARHRRDLAAELMADHERLHSRKRWTMIKQTPWFRPLLACLCVAVIGVAACNAPTEYEVQMGQHLNLSIPDVAKSGDGLFGQIEDMVQFVENWPDVEGVSVSVNELEGGPVAVDLMVWGQALDGNALAGAVTDEFPALADAEVTIEPLNGTAEGNLGEAFGHAVFDLEITGETVEEIQAQILQQIAEQGFTGDAVVEVHEEDGVQTINVELTDVVEEADGSQGETEDTIVIERIQE